MMQWILQGNKHLECSDTVLGSTEHGQTYLDYSEEISKSRSE